VFYIKDNIIGGAPQFLFGPIAIVRRVDERITFIIFNKLYRKLMCLESSSRSGFQEIFFILWSAEFPLACSQKPSTSLFHEVDKYKTQIILFMDRF
jgi:hypothetical protein